MAYSIVATKPGGPEVLQKKEIEVPQPGPGEALLRHTAIGVNFLDAYFRTGLYPWAVESDLVLGSEAAGVVEAVGSSVSNLSPGDRVVYTAPNGAYASHRVIDAKTLVKIPDGISDEIAAASFLKGLTAYYLLHSSFAVKEGDAVLFHAAAGGVGLIVGQWLAAKGVRAIGTAGGPEKCALALDHGYSDVIDYRKDDFVAKLKELAPGGVEAVYDSVGKTTWQGSLKCLKQHGTFVSFGQSSGPITGFNISELAVGSFHATRPTLFHFVGLPGWLDKASAALFDQIGSGAVRININQTFDLSDAASAHTALEGRQTTGCTILTP